MFSSISNRIQRIGAKRLVIATGFVVAMAAATGLGLAAKQFTTAASIPRDCDNNAILKCGAAGPVEFIKDVNSLNTINHPKQPDLKDIYASGYANLPSTEYKRFQDEAKMGWVHRDGRVTVNGKTVMTNAKSMGRQKFNSNRKALTIKNKTYYYSTTQSSFASGTDAISAMVLFDKRGIAQSVIMTSCGNPVWGTKPSYACNALKSEKVNNDTHRFWTEVSVAGGATVSRVVYDFGNGVKVEKKNPAEKVTYTYPSAGVYDAKVTVYFNLPGYGEVAVPPVKCLKRVEVVKPFYACDALEAVALNNEKTKYRFTVKARAGNGATVKDADFTLDGKNTTTGVTTADAQGNIYKEYSFAQDGSDHEVVAKVNFNLASKVTSVTCKAKIEVGKAPECVEKPGSGLPPGHPDCYVCPIPGKEDLPKDKCVENCPVEGKEHLPKDSDECEETPPVLPETGMGSVLGLFAGTSVVGAVAHRVISNRRNS